MKCPTEKPGISFLSNGGGGRIPPTRHKQVGTPFEHTYIRYYKNKNTRDKLGCFCFVAGGGFEPPTCGL